MSSASILARAVVCSIITYYVGQFVWAVAVEFKRLRRQQEQVAKLRRLRDPNAP